MVLLAFILSFAFLIALACFPNVARSYPTNIVCLACFTVLEGFLVGVSAARYAPSVLVMAALGTVIIVAALGLFAWQTRIDFTRFSGIALVLLVVLLIVGICMSFFPADSRVYLVYAGLGLAVFGFLLVIDIQRIIGGEHKYQFGLDDYVFAALAMYLDIINIFLFLAAILGGGRR